jgi:hypothetical protein
MSIARSWHPAAREGMSAVDRGEAALSDKPPLILAVIAC